MKKILSYILSLTVILSTFVISPMMTAQAKDNFNQMSRYVLTYLGIIEATDGVGVTEPITRAEFSEYLLKALKLPEVADKVYFKDVPKDFWGAGAINALYEAGIISSSPTGNFNPNVPITYEQICKMLVVAAGYAEFSKFEGPIMTSYVTTARNCGIETTPDDFNNVTFDEAIEMLFEGMFVTIPEVTGNGLGGKISEVEEDGDTIFSIYHDLYKGSGQVRSLFGMSVDNRAVKENEADIDDEIYELDTDLSGVFGQEIDFIYREDRDETKTVICAVASEDSKTVINSDRIISVDASAGRMQYYPENTSSKSKSISFEPKATVIFNGRVIEGRISEKIEEFISGSRKGTVEFIETKGSNGYDLIVIKSYEIFTVGIHDAEKEILYSYYDSTNTIKLDEFKNISIKDTNGLTAVLPTVFPATLQIAESENGEILEIISCNEKKKINVLGINSEREIETADAVYKIEESVYDRFSTLVRAGGAYTVTLDGFGDIVYVVSEDSSGMQIGWLRKAYMTEDNDGQKNGLFIYNHAEDVSKRYDFAKRVVIDGDTYSDDKIKNLFLAFPGDTEINVDSMYVKLTPQIIRFSLNADGKIATVDTENAGAKEDKKNSLKNIGEGDYYFSASHGWYGIGISWVTGTTKTMQVPLLDADGYVDINGEKRYDDDSMYKNVSQPADWSRFNVVAYKWSDDNLIADMIVTKRQPSTDSLSTHVFNKITKAVDSDGEVRDVLNVFTDGAARTYYIDSSCLDDANALNTGDIIQIALDFKGDGVMTITKMFDAKTKTFGATGSFTDPNRAWWNGAVPTENTVGGLGGWRSTGPQLAKGYASVMKGGMIGIAFTLSDARDGKWTMPVSGAPVIIYDEEVEKGDKIYVGTMNDIKTYEIFGEDCSYIVYGATSGKVRHIIVYR